MHTLIGGECRQFRLCVEDYVIFINKLIRLGCNLTFVFDELRDFVSVDKNILL